MKRSTRWWALTCIRRNPTALLTPWKIYGSSMDASEERNEGQIVIPVTVTYDDGTHRKAQRRIAPKKR